MGQLCSKTDDLAAETANLQKKQEKLDKKLSETISKGLKEDYNNEKLIVKMLLLGAGESGKSTIFKQLKILNLSGFSMEERHEASKNINYNIMCALRDVCMACRDLNILFGSDDNRQRSNLILSLDPRIAQARDYKADIKQLWADSGVKMAMTRTNEFYIIDSAEYFVGQNLDRICEDGYIPNDQDVLRCRKATGSSVPPLEFKVDSTLFKVFDVGGQRGKRKKWIQCFDNVTAIIFVASLSEYDQELMEHKGKNRMHESLQLFEGILSLPWFKKTPVILFLNKRDIFEDKLKHSDLSRYFPSYNGGDDVEKAMQFIKVLYEKRKPLAKEDFYPHFTCATDTSNMKFVMKATVTIIMKRCLEAYGLLDGAGGHI